VGMASLQAGWSNWKLRYQPGQVRYRGISPQNLRSKFCRLINFCTLRKNKFHTKFHKSVVTQLRRAEHLKRKFDDTTWATTPIFSDITSISKATISSYGAKGLRLHEVARTWSLSRKSITIAVKKKPTQLEATHWEVLATITPEIW
jgi:hypothetical protein